jgi:hypothetical protein
MPKCYQTGQEIEKLPKWLDTVKCKFRSAEADRAAAAVIQAMVAEAYQNLDDDEPTPPEEISDEIQVESLEDQEPEEEEEPEI